MISYSGAMQKPRYAPNLKEYLRTHAEETIYDTESEDHGHAIDESIVPDRGMWSVIQDSPSKR